MRRFLNHISPQWMIDIYKNIKKRYRHLSRIQISKTDTIVTEQTIREQLISHGVNHNDVLMVHSSLSKLGYVQGGAHTVLNALINYIRPNGTLMMPAFPAIGFNYDYLKTKPVFDINKTPSKMGIITELFRQYEGVQRSFHPTDSVCALGLKAQYLVSTHFNQLTPYNQNSPFFKLCELRGKILLIGVDLSSLTNLHTIEDAVDDFKFPVYHQSVFSCEILDKEGKIHTVKTKVHDPVYSKKRRCNDLAHHFEKAGFLKKFKIGLANCMLIDANPMHEWMVENYHNKGITMYTPNG